MCTSIYSGRQQTTIFINNGESLREWCRRPKKDTTLKEIFSISDSEHTLSNNPLCYLNSIHYNKG